VNRAHRQARDRRQCAARRSGLLDEQLSNRAGFVLVGVNTPKDQAERGCERYGVTTALQFLLREIWAWSPMKAGAVALIFLIVDFGFFTANVTKVLEGGYVPLLLAVTVYGAMWI
jgi:K+ potassium transporter